MLVTQHLCLSLASWKKTELLRAYLVFTLCRFPVFVRHSEALSKLSYRWLGHSLTTALLKASFFGHFAGGEDVEAVGRLTSKLKSSGVDGIWNYSVEAEKGFQWTAEQLERNTVEFMRSVEHIEPGGFVALKMTALFDLSTLEKGSLLLNIVNANPNIHPDLIAAIESGSLTNLMEHVRLHLPLYETTFSEADVTSCLLAFNRICRIARLASERKVKILIDAEQSAIQPLIKFGTRGSFLKVHFMFYLKI